MVGSGEGLQEGSFDWDRFVRVVLIVGTVVCDDVGTREGETVGSNVGSGDGLQEGSLDGNAVGTVVAAAPVA